MQCYRLLYWHWHSGYNEKTFVDGLKMVFIPDQKGSYIPCIYYHNEKAPDGKLVLYYHGIWQDLGAPTIHMVVKEMAETWNTNVLVVEYPGYGEHFKDGITRTHDIVNESRIVLEFLMRDLNLRGSDIILYGYSMGTGV